MINIESIGIIDTVHQSLDFSSFSQITNIELEGGTTIDGGLITTTLAANQSLTLDSIIDGDTSAASLGDGGIRLNGNGDNAEISVNSHTFGNSGIQLVNDESLRDTLIDLHNYSAMAIMLLDQDKKENNISMPPPPPSPISKR